MEKMWTLVLDTATPYLSLGLFRAEAGVGRVKRVERRHEEVFFGLLEEVLKEVGAGREEIGTLVLGEGPGSYTGLRIALAAGLGVALAQGAKVYGVSSLLAACWPYLKEGEPLTSLFTARNGLFYGATYTLEGGRPKEVAPPRKLKAQELPREGRLLLDPPPDPRALYELLPFAHEGVEPLYL